MSLRKAKLPTFDGVPSGTLANTTTASVELNSGELVHNILLKCSVAAGSVGLGTLQAPTLLGDVRVKVDGTPIWSLSAQRIAALNALMNDPGGSEYTTKTSGTGASLVSYLHLFFAEPWRQGWILSDGVLVPEGPVWALPVTDRRVTLEVDIKAAIVDPVLSGTYEYEPTKINMGRVIARETHNMSVSSVAPNLPIEKWGGKEGTDGLVSMHIFPTIQTTSAYVSSAKLTRNKVEFRQDIGRYENDAYLISRKMNPPALDTTSDTTIKNTGAYHLVFDDEDSFRRRLEVAGTNEVTLTPTFNTAPAGGLDIVVQKIIQP